MLAVVLPGRAYPASMPVLALVVDVLERHGYDVRAVSWTLSELPADPAAWVTERLVAAAADGCDLVVGKSLGAWAAAYAAKQAWPALWLTPVLSDPRCAAGIRANPASQLVIGGLADPTHDTAVAATLGCDVVEIAAADHALTDTDDVVPSVAIQQQMTAAADAFLSGLARLG